MTDQPRFPSELLTQPVSARLAYFEHKLVAHPRLKEIHNALWQAVRQPGSASLIMVYGPSGVGKTTLRFRLEQQLLSQAELAMQEDPGHIPVVGMEVPAPELGNFNWKDYYTRALLALHEPMIEAKIDRRSRGLLPGRGGQLVFERRVNLPDLRQALEHSLQQRRPSAFIVDEAQHLAKLSRGRRLLDQMDNLKSLAAMSGTTHVLIGTYQLLSLVGLNGQLSRRSLELHFPRYRWEEAEDAAAFKSVLLTFEQHLPLTQPPNLVEQPLYFYERCVGCVGILKTWLNRALAIALEEGQATLTPQLLERLAPPTGKLLVLAREIKEGEERLSERVGQRTELQRLLGLNPEPARSLPEIIAPAVVQPKARAGRGRVGQRSLKRDAVGQLNNLPEQIVEVKGVNNANAS